MKKFAFLLVGLFIFMTIFAGACDEQISSAEQRQAKQTNKILDEANRQFGLPNIHNFQQKKIMKMIYEETDREDLICYAYIKSDYRGELVFIGKCIGYGVPFSAQYTNPMKSLNDGCCSGMSNTILPQADPNGLYMPTSSSATWLMMIDPKTKKPRPVYIEPEIVVSPFPLKD